MRQSHRARPFRSVDRLATILALLLLLCVACSLVDMMLSLIEMDVLERIRRDPALSREEVVGAIDRSVLVTRVVLAMFLVTGLVWLAWQHRAQANLWAIGAPRLRFTPGWAVAWWFIPIANLVMPARAVRELWKESGGANRWEEMPTWRAIGWWWACWVATSGLSLLGWGAALGRLSDPAALIADDRLAILRDMATVWAGIFAISVVQVISRRQGSLAAPPGSDVLPSRPGMAGRPFDPGL